MSGFWCLLSIQVNLNLVHKFVHRFRFLNLIGTVFSFVSSDVKSKIEVMEKHHKSENAIYYDSFKKMMKYEKDTYLYEKNGFVSGSRTMLRLHRGLGMYERLITSGHGFYTFLLLS